METTEYFKKFSVYDVCGSRNYTGHLQVAIEAIGGKKDHFELGFGFNTLENVLKSRTMVEQILRFVDLQF